MLTDSPARKSRHSGAARFDDCRTHVGYLNGMDAEQTIAEIECIERIFAEPDTRPLSPSDLAAANRRHDEMQPTARGFGSGGSTGFAAGLKLTPGYSY